MPSSEIQEKIIYRRVAESPRELDLTTKHTKGTKDSGMIIFYLRALRDLRGKIGIVFGCVSAALGRS
jgi:hypothetical protein